MLIFIHLIIVCNPSYINIGIIMLGFSTKILFSRIFVSFLDILNLFMEFLDSIIHKTSVFIEKKF